MSLSVWAIQCGRMPCDASEQVVFVLFIFLSPHPSHKDSSEPNLEHVPCGKTLIECNMQLFNTFVQQIVINNMCF